MKHLIPIVTTAFAVFTASAQTDSTAPAAQPAAAQIKVLANTETQVEGQAEAQVDTAASIEVQANPQVDMATTDEVKPDDQAKADAEAAAQAEAQDKNDAEAEAQAEVKKQLDEAQKDVEKKLKDAEKQLEKSRHEINRRVFQTQSDVHSISGFGGGASAGGGGTGFGGGKVFSRRYGTTQWNPLVIRSKALDPKAQANLNEDLTVMRRVLEKALNENASEEARTLTAMGIDVFYSPVGNSMKSLYLEGYGALFFLDVNYPLVAAAKAEDKTKSTGNSSEWEAAKKDVFGQPSEEDAEASEPFNTEKVAKLQERLVKALKNASNIRALKSSETVTICVVGGSNGGLVQHHTVVTGPEKGTRTIRNIQWNATASSSQNRTILTLSATKSDIEAYAQGKLNTEEFTKKATINSYADEPAEHGVATAQFPMEFQFGGITK